MNQRSVCVRGCDYACQLERVCTVISVYLLVPSCAKRPEDCCLNSSPVCSVQPDANCVCVSRCVCLCASTKGQAVFNANSL